MESLLKPLTDFLTIRCDANGHVVLSDADVQRIAHAVVALLNTPATETVIAEWARPTGESRTTWVTKTPNPNK